mmetsp:Transcript_10299/g.16693  ORF Transcript_10299/g.16693 Transcript_10299/m.16693 type:complete len:262 (-) Transcript_10299:367-1152(-)
MFTRFCCPVEDAAAAAAAAAASPVEDAVEEGVPPPPAIATADEEAVEGFDAPFALLPLIKPFFCFAAILSAFFSSSLSCFAIICSISSGFWIIRLDASWQHWSQSPSDLSPLAMWRIIDRMRSYISLNSFCWSGSTEDDDDDDGKPPGSPLTRLAPPPEGCNPSFFIFSIATSSSAFTNIRRCSAPREIPTTYERALRCCACCLSHSTRMPPRPSFFLCSWTIAVASRSCRYAITRQNLMATTTPWMLSAAARTSAFERNV